MAANPAALTKKDLGHFHKLLKRGLLTQAYDELATHRYQYAALANGVVKGDTFSGRIALEFLAKTAEAQDRPLSEADVDAIRLAMAKAYLDTLSLQASRPAALVTRDVVAEEAWKFHSTVFQDQGLGPGAWTLNLPFTLMDAGARQNYWAFMLNSAGDFTKEVLLGLATDFIVKQAAIDLSAPKKAVDALAWLHRLHNLDTYLTAAEIIGPQLDRLAAAILPALADKLQNGLDAPAIDAILGYFDQAYLDEQLKTQLNALSGGLDDP